MRLVTVRVPEALWLYLERHRRTLERQRREPVNLSEATRSLLELGHFEALRELADRNEVPF